MNGYRGGKWCGGERFERVGKEREEGLYVASGGLDGVPLFRRHANVARCDITEDVEWGCKLEAHPETLSHALRVLNEPIPKDLNQRV